MLAMRACTHKCKSGEYEVRSQCTGTRGGIAATRFVHVWCYLLYASSSMEAC